MKAARFARLPTEQENPRSRSLDRLSSRQIAQLMNREDQAVLIAVRHATRVIGAAVDVIAQVLQRGGKLYFVGAGTSGRLGVIEAAECPPTFGTSPSQIIACMAGGSSAVFRSKEGAEDSHSAGKAAVAQIRSTDVVVGIAASGITPYVRSALKTARSRHAKTILLTCNPLAVRERVADITIALKTGPEVITGSTRLKAGSACKMVLNMLTTASMVRIGKVFGHWMVDLQPKSAKLVARGTRLIARLGRVNERRAEQIYREAKGRVKMGILMARLGLTRLEAERRLKTTPNLREALR